MPDRRRITDVAGLTQVHVNFRDALRPIVREPLCFDIIWPDLIVDALQLIKSDELATALVAAGVDRDSAIDVCLILTAFGLSADDMDGAQS
jgi:hypothetical protein